MSESMNEKQKIAQELHKKWMETERFTWFQNTERGKYLLERIIKHREIWEKLKNIIKVLDDKKKGFASVEIEGWLHLKKDDEKNIKTEKVDKNIQDIIDIIDKADSFLDEPNNDNYFEIKLYGSIE